MGAVGEVCGLCGKVSMWVQWVSVGGLSMWLQCVWVGGWVGVLIGGCKGGWVKWEGKVCGCCW